ncbi:MAG: formylglycine-generating enzyme family protein, partial [Bacteroidales bacterium]|nr:formylglycine-generating enzyme family protein [Bacteroidales bacterium]
YGMLDEKLFEDNSNESTQKQYAKIIAALSKLSENEGKCRNLFVIDVNNCDGEKLDDFVKKMITGTRDSNRMIPKDWMVIVVTRYPLKIERLENFSINYNPKKIANDEKYLTTLFKNISGYKDADKILLKRVFENMCYSPLLVKLLASKIKTDNNKNLLKKIGDSKLSVIQNFNDKQLNDVDKVEKTIGEYAKSLVDFDNLPYNSRLVLSFFMIWPAVFVNKEIVINLLDQYGMIRNDNRKTDGFLCFKRYLHKEDTESNVKLVGVLNKLVERNLLEKSDNSYSLHPFLGDVLRSLILHKQDWTQYQKNCNLYLSNKAYFDCIYSSYERDVFDTSFKRDLKRKALFRNWITEKDILGLIKIASKTDYSELADKYLELAILRNDKLKEDSESAYCNALEYYNKIKDKTDEQKLRMAEAYCRLGFLKEYENNSLANEYYNNALSIYKQYDNLDKKSTRFYAALQCYFCFYKDTTYDKPEEDVVEVFLANYEALQQYEIGDSDFVKYVKAILFCRLADNIFRVDDEAITLYKKSVRLFDDFSNDSLSVYALKNKANVNYRFVFLSEREFSVEPPDEIDYNNPYNPTTRSFRDEVKALWDNFKEPLEKNVQTADEIFASLPPEIEGDLKGFIKTSYGIYDPVFGFKMVKVEKGNFKMGISDAEFEKLSDEDKENFKRSQPQHDVEITVDFYVGMYPITKGQWFDGRNETDRNIVFDSIDKFADIKQDAIKTNILYAQQKQGFETLKEIVIDGDDNMKSAMYGVNWYDAEKYIAAVNDKTEELHRVLEYRLPAEAEWEYAARGGNMSGGYPYSGSDKPFDVAYCLYGLEFPKRIEKSEVTTMHGVGPTDVGSRKPNELGIYDMSGNVWEWCQDWYGDYPSDYSIDPHGPDFGAYRVLRGGSWLNGASYCRVSNRYYYNPVSRYHDSGFRLFLSSQKK